MKYENIIIRTKEELETAKSVVKTALIAEAKSKSKIEFPLVYRYLGKSKPYGNNHILQEDVIGKIYNIRFDMSGNVVCDVITNDIMEKSKHFSNIIDNVVVGMLQTRNHRSIPAIINGIVYDKYAKSVIDERAKTNASFDSVVKMDENPISDKIAKDKDFNPLMVGGSDILSMSYGHMVEEVTKNE